MGSGLRQAAVYQFLAEAWRGEARLLAYGDPAELLSADAPAGVAALGAELLPDAPTPAPVTALWPAADLPPPRRRGVRFVGAGEIAAAVRDRPWRVAVVSWEAACGPDGGLSSLGRVLAERIAGDPDRGVAVVAAGADRGGPGYEDMADLAVELGGGRLFALYRAQAFGVVEFGDPIDPANSAAGDRDPWGTRDDDHPGAFDPDGNEDAGGGPYEDGADEDYEAEDAGDEGVEDGDSEDEDIAYDNERMVADPPVETWILCAGGLLGAFSPASFTVVEFDPAEAGAAGDAGAADHGICAAREQELRWRLEQAEAEVQRLRSRPVDALEAELAALRAREAERGRDRGTEASVSDEGPRPPPPPSQEEGAAQQQPRRTVRTDPRAEGTWRHLAMWADRVDRWSALLRTDAEVAVDALQRDLAQLSATLRRILRHSA